MTTAGRIRGYMAMRGVRVKDMAKLFKITTRTWSSWMRHPEKLSIGRLTVIAAKLDVSPADLIGGES